jgi:type IV pilus assembly protein PilQ
MDHNIKRKTEFKALSVMLIMLALLFSGCVAYEAAGPSKVAEPAKVLKKITAIKFAEDAETVSIWITGNQVLTYTSVKQSFPASVIFYFPDTSLEDIEPSLSVDSEIVESVKATELAGKGQTSRVGILLKQDMAYDVSRAGLGLKISFARTAAVDQEVPEETSDTQIQAAVREEASAATVETWAAASLLTGIDTEPDDTGVTVNINANGAIKDFDAFTIKNPARIVIDVYGVNSPHKKEQTILVNSESVRRVRHFKSPDKLRIVIDTKDAFLDDFTVDTVEPGLLVKVGTGMDAVMESKELESEKMSQEAAATVVEASQPPKPVATTQKPAWINRLDFSSEENGKSTFILGTTRPVTYRMEKVGDLGLQLRLFNANLPGYRRRPLITTRFESAVDRIMPVQTPAMKDSSVITFELRESVPYFVEQVDDILFVHFDPSSVPPKPMDDADLPSWQKVIAQAEQGGVDQAPLLPSAVAVTAEEPTAAVPVAAAGTPQQAEPVEEPLMGQPRIRTGGGKNYTGEKIALDFYETDIKNVFRILREVSGKNYAIDKDVSGKVTLTLEKPVPWDQVLDLVLRMNSLGMVYEDDIVRIATLSTLKNELVLRQEALEAIQKSKEAEKALEPLITAYIPINYSDATADILPHLQNIITEGRGTLSVHTATNQVIMKDVAAKIEEAKIMVSKLDVVTAQVLIEARIVEATSAFKKELGTILTASAGPITQINGNNQSYSLASNFPKSSKSIFDVTFNKVSGTPFTLNAKINALEEEGESKTISSPKVLTLDNKPATIKQGVSYPINKLDADGNSTTEFKDIVLELTVTPHVTMDGRVSMAIKITKNDIGTLIGSNFSFTVNEANTELLVNDGDTIVIGGVTKTKDISGEEGIPGLRNIPGLGWLFGSKATDKSKEELLIFITPKIVKLD